jgi:2,3-bisphosphoglycerate-dependent phosphoglycerate mutase
VRLILIRHAQSANNVLAESDGHDYDLYMATRVPEPPLTEVGHRQAVLLAQQLADAAARAAVDTERSAWLANEHPISELYVSPMLRALQTAAPIACALGLAPQVWVDIHEHGGIFTGNPDKANVVGYPGLTRAEMAAQFPTFRVLDGVGDDGWWHGGYEEIDVCYVRAQRVAAALYAMAADRPDATVALVTHGTFLDNLMHALFVPGEAYDERVHFSNLNTAVSRVDFDAAGRVALRYLNRIDHLPPDVVSR